MTLQMMLGNTHKIMFFLIPHQSFRDQNLLQALTMEVSYEIIACCSTIIGVNLDYSTLLHKCRALAKRSRIKVQLLPLHSPNKPKKTKSFPG